MNHRWIKMFMPLLAVCFLQSIKAQTSYTIKTVAGFPSGEAGYSLGVSACYSGMIDDWLVVAGGCNFPEIGKKKYYAGIYAAKASVDTLGWKLVGYLPEPAAYGGVVALGDSLIFVGGNNSEHSLNTVLSIRLDDSKGKAIMRLLPSLPCTVDNMAVTCMDGYAYVLGGNQDGKASSALWRWNVGSKNDWECLSSIPDNPRVQPVCVANGGKLYTWGGFFANGLKSVVATDGYCYDVISRTWKKTPPPTDSIGNSLTLTGGIAVHAGITFLCLGGVNKEIFWDAISGSYRLVRKEDYLQKAPSWYRFNGYLLQFDLGCEEWNIFPSYDKRLARAGAQLVQWNDKFFYVGGEIKPGVRTSEIMLLCPK